MDTPILRELAAISVVVVTYNGAPWIRRCLSSLLKNGSTEAEVIVVDNASADDTCEIVAREFPSVVLIRSERNEGFGPGNNHGIRHALDRGAEYVFLLNQDAYVLPDTLRELGDFMGAHPEIGVVSPLHCSPDAEHLDEKTLRNYLHRYATDYLSDACMGRQAPYYPTFGVNAAAWFVSSKVWLKAGGFDPLFFMYGEDDDLLLRWRHHDIRFALLPSSRIVHLRESVPSPRVGAWGTIKRLARRRRAELLNSIKRPHHSLAHMVLALLGEGFVEPFADLLVARRGKLWLGEMLAAFQLIPQFPQICRHAALTSQTGKHFL